MYVCTLYMSTVFTFCIMDVHTSYNFLKVTSLNLTNLKTQPTTSI